MALGSPGAVRVMGGGYGRVMPDDERDPDVEWADFQRWMQHGVNRGWCSLPVCNTHDGLPMTDGEAALWDEGYDPCQHVLRLWSGDEP